MSCIQGVQPRTRCTCTCGWRSAHTCWSTPCSSVPQVLAADVQFTELRDIFNSLDAKHAQATVEEDRQRILSDIQVSAPGAATSTPAPCPPPVGARA